MRLGNSTGEGKGRNENRHERKMVKYRPSLTGRAAFFFSIGNGQSAGLDTDLLHVGKEMITTEKQPLQELALLGCLVSFLCALHEVRSSIESISRASRATKAEGR